MKPLVIAHRGAWGYAPQNTILSFQKAIDLGADMIEFDVRQNRQGIPIVFHDGRLGRITKGRGLVKEKTLAELKKLDLGQGQTIPTLKEILDFIKARVGVNIEIKDPGIEEKVLEIVKKSKIALNKVIISSKKPEIIALIKKLDFRIRTALVFARLPDDWIKFVLKLGVYAIHPRGDIVNSWLINQAHKNNLRVNVWTINKLADIKRVKKMGVDGIITNFPDRI